MLLSRIAAAAVCLFSLFLTACSDAPSKDDCASAMNKYLNNHTATIPVPGEYVSGDGPMFFITLPESFIADYPEIKYAEMEDKAFNRSSMLNTESKKTEVQRDIELANLLQKGGYVTIEPGIIKKQGFGIGKRDCAGLKIIPNEKIMDIIIKDFFGTPKIRVGKYAADEISEIAPEAVIENGYKYFYFKYTKKIVDLTEGFTAEDAEKFAKEIFNDSHAYQDKRKARAAKIEGEWTCDKNIFFMGF